MNWRGWLIGLVVAALVAEGIILIAQPGTTISFLVGLGCVLAGTQLGLRWHRKPKLYVTCDAERASCCCARPLGHEGPHVCACSGSWDDAGNIYHFPDLSYREREPEPPAA